MFQYNAVLCIVAASMLLLAAFLVQLAFTLASADDRAVVLGAKARLEGADGRSCISASWTASGPPSSWCNGTATDAWRVPGPPYTGSPTAFSGVVCDGAGFVIALLLQSCNLTGSLPDLQLPRLRWLDLSGNSISGLLPRFLAAPQLEFIALNNTAASGPLPPESSARQPAHGSTA